MATASNAFLLTRFSDAQQVVTVEGNAEAALLEPTASDLTAMFVEAGLFCGEENDDADTPAWNAAADAMEVTYA